MTNMDRNGKSGREDVAINTDFSLSNGAWPHQSVENMEGNCFFAGLDYSPRVTKWTSHQNLVG